jgi:hypothetical protein
VRRPLGGHSKSPTLDVATTKSSEGQTGRLA